MRSVRRALSHGQESALVGTGRTYLELGLGVAGSFCAFAGFAAALILQEITEKRRTDRWTTTVRLKRMSNGCWNACVGIAESRTAGPRCESWLDVVVEFASRGTESQSQASR